MLLNSAQADYSRCRHDDAAGCATPAGHGTTMTPYAVTLLRRCRCLRRPYVVMMMMARIRHCSRMPAAARAAPAPQRRYEAEEASHMLVSHRLYIGYHKATIRYAMPPARHG